ncbi:UPF0149 family protein [Testudinibacter sp. TR-2022]|uniref:UPF0149 family protein n=1 Tax=Testudinibacter sp. TR-2022 TaxID=2585029 RepID=UPI00111AAB9C|nr:UPF0149 family protein [Testudinibacter sp. TR-2022]TNH06596.1 UPF0149 family protein [Pasteurellaceae bacterium Phil11]TNH18345.1 UPF0149 family protein [Testudinibacter sp. TR-2022]TNH24820.1 UPF0149 family protein [Testudinibacter sp. TR-2022]
MTTTTLDYRQFNQLLKTHQIGLNAAELHGFLSGLLCGGGQKANWKSLTYQFTNEGHAYPTDVMQKVEQLYQEIDDSLSDEEHFSFEIWLDESNQFNRADSLSDWTNHFLLGLGLARPQLEQDDDEVQEAVADLNDIARLGYEEDDDAEELDVALTEISEYLQTIAMFFYSSFNQKMPVDTRVLH